MPKQKKMSLNLFWFLLSALVFFWGGGAQLPSGEVQGLTPQRWMDGFMEETGSGNFDFEHFTVARTWTDTFGDAWAGLPVREGVSSQVPYCISLYLQAFVVFLVWFTEGIGVE